MPPTRSEKGPRPRRDRTVEIAVWAFALVEAIGIAALVWHR